MGKWVSKSKLCRVVLYISERHYEQLQHERVRRGYKSLSRTGRELLLEGLRSTERQRHWNALRAMNAAGEDEGEGEGEGGAVVEPGLPFSSYNQY